MGRTDSWRLAGPRGDSRRVSHGERWISAAGGAVGILAVLWASRAVLDLQGAAMVVGSVGATAVLLFAVPHGALSQPWPVLGGHLVSGFIGVTCAREVGDPLMAAGAAVGLAIAAMHYLRCIHPPGGATALVAVLGGDAVHQLGYGFLLTPVLVNVLVLLTLAVVVNRPFPWRRYPAGREAPATGSGKEVMIAHSDLVFALSQLDSFIDVTEQDLVRIYTLAVRHSRHPMADPAGCELEGTARLDHPAVCNGR